MAFCHNSYLFLSTIREGIPDNNNLSKYENNYDLEFSNIRVELYRKNLFVNICMFLLILFSRNNWVICVHKYVGNFPEATEISSSYNMFDSDQHLEHI